MVFIDPNKDVSEGSLSDQLQGGDQSLGDYPSYGQDRSDSGNPLLFSDVQEEAKNNEIDNAAIQETPQGDVNVFQELPEPIAGDTNLPVENVGNQDSALQENTAQSLSGTENVLQEENNNEDVDNILNQIEETPDLLDDSAESLAGYQLNQKLYTIKTYNTGFLIASALLIIFCVGTYGLYLFYEYLNLKSQPTVPYEKQESVQRTSDYYDEYGEKIGLFDLATFQNYDIAAQPERVNDLLKDPGLNFVQKKDSLQFALTNLGNKIIDLKNDATALREKMNKDGFFPQELVSILDNDSSVASIQRSLVSLEVVKFTSAIRVFSLMDDIIKDLADNFNYTKSEIKNKLNDLIERGEKDSEYYLNVCYNNPYEPEDCNKINDFDKYYKRISDIVSDKNFDTQFFKKLMKYINNQLEYNQLPYFSITFNNFDGGSNSIGFTVEVNTTLEDETALIQQGIKSPHIFILSELIKLLKQSTFIVGKSIEAKDIRVAPTQVSIAGRQFVVNNSVTKFTLPIQKTTEREIFDYVDNYSPVVQSTSVSDMISSMLSEITGNDGVEEENTNEEVVDESIPEYITSGNNE